MGVTQYISQTNGLRRAAILCAAILCFVLGLISLPLPIPTGAILLAMSFALFLTVSRRAKVWFRKVRRRTPWLDAKLALIDNRLPDELRRALSGRRKSVFPQG